MLFFSISTWELDVGKDISNLSSDDQAIFRAAVNAIGGDITARYQASIALQSRSELLTWVCGSSSGGSYGDGTYPFTLPDGSVVRLPSISKLTTLVTPDDDPGDLTILFDNKLV